MKKCPECLTSYEDSSRFCKKCGQKLKSTRSNSFRNFMIIIIVIVSIIVTGLVTYYILANYTGNDLSSLFSKGAKLIGYQEEQESETSGDSSTVILTKEKPSADQTRVISLFGYPDQFTIIFDESNNKRVDTCNSDSGARRRTHKPYNLSFYDIGSGKTRILQKYF